MFGLVLSGWRGTVGKIVPNAIQLMQKNGAETGEIRCFLGPAIGICCYEVDGEVADLFDEEAKLQLNNGKWKEQQLISEDWIKLATTPSSTNPRYGYLWWLNTNEYFSIGIKIQIWWS